MQNMALDGTGRGVKEANRNPAGREGDILGVSNHYRLPH